MTSTPTIRQGLAEAADFARDAWRDCWAVMLVIVIGRTLVFMGHHVSETEWRPWLWPQIGDVLSLAYIPLFGALYRMGVGGPALEGLGWGGLQWTGVEWRLLGVWTVLGFALFLCAMPLALVSFPLLYLFKHHAAVSLGPLGGWSFAAILLAPFWAAFAGFVLFMWGRLGLAAAATTAKGRVAPFSAWRFTQGLGWTIAAAWLVVQLPTLIGWLGLWAMSVAEAGDLSSRPAEIWPLVDASAAGAVTGVLAAMIQAPLTVGLLCGFHRWLCDTTPESRAILDETKSLEAALDAAHDEPAFKIPEPEEAQGALSLWPHTVLPRGHKRPVLERAEPAPEFDSSQGVIFEAAAEPAPSVERFEPAPELSTLQHPPEPEPAMEFAANSALAPGPDEAEHPFKTPIDEGADRPLASALEAGQTSHTDPEPYP